MKPLNTLMIVGLAVTCVGTAYARADRPDIERLGHLVQSNSSGVSRYYGTSAFMKTNRRGYVTQFAKKLARTSEEVPVYEDVLRQAIWKWETKDEVRGFTSDLAGALAFYTVTNLGIAQNENSKDYLIPNLVDQYKKCLASRQIARMSNSQKEDLYDYMVTESIYQEVLIASEPERQQPEILTMMQNMSASNVQDVFGVSPTVLSVTESGLTFQ